MRPSPRRMLTIGMVVCVFMTLGCTRVHPHLALPNMSVGEPSFFPTIEALTGSPIVGGNHVDLLLNGEQIFPAMLQAVRGARRTITYEQYYYEDGPVARDLAEAFAERCRAGLGVNILLDAFGALNIPRAYVDLMRQSGCHVEFFRPITREIFGRANNRSHRRMLVVDGQIGFTGGSGVSRKWMGNGRVENHWRDTDVRIEGPLVEYLQGAFSENWLETTGIVLGGDAYFPRLTSPEGRVYGQVIRSSPEGGSFAVYTTFLLAIASARRTIFITNPYFVLDRTMEDALLNARRRGVRVVVLVPGAIDHNLVRQASRGRFGRMLRAGIEIWEYHAALLHAKTAVIDGVWSTIGSTNLDNRSFTLNEELNVVIYNRAIAQRLEQVFGDDLRWSRPVRYRDWRARSLLERFLETLTLPIRDLL